MQVFKKILFFISAIVLVVGTYWIFPDYKSGLGMKKIWWWERPEFSDDLETSSLVQAIKKNLVYLDRLPNERSITFGSREIVISQLKESFYHFLTILEEVENEEELRKRILKDFDIFRSVGSNKKKEVLFTGYYEPVYAGSRKRTERFQYPIYRKPDDLLRIDLGDFVSDLKGKRITARVENNKVVPYHERKNIDSQGVLQGKGLELAWLAHPLDPFFLQIQGSGIINTKEGESINVNYAAANGRAYRSIGRLLIKDGKVPKEKMSMKAIREYLVSHPEDLTSVLNYNKSYVFFREVEKGPIGSTAVTLTSGRSIASDKTVFPKGGLAYIETEVPVTDNDGNLLGWEKISRFVIDQDTGGAIKGSGRVDIFFGTGKDAGNLAGAMNRRGKLFYLIKKADN